jgi:hypothetical protein
VNVSRCAAGVGFPDRGPGIYWWLFGKPGDECGAGTGAPGGQVARVGRVYLALSECVRYKQSGARMDQLWSSDSSWTAFNLSRPRAIGTRHV